jgi:hypothetical protein
MSEAIRTFFVSGIFSLHLQKASKKRHRQIKEGKRHHIFISVHLKMAPTDITDVELDVL